MSRPPPRRGLAGLAEPSPATDPPKDPPLQAAALRCRAVPSLRRVLVIAEARRSVCEGIVRKESLRDGWSSGRPATPLHAGLSLHTGPNTLRDASLRQVP